MDDVGEPRPEPRAGWKPRCLALGAITGLILAGGVGVGALRTSQAVASHQSDQGWILADLSAEGLGVSEGELTYEALPAAEFDAMWAALRRVETMPEDEQAALELWRMEAFTGPGKAEFVGMPEEERLLEDPKAWRAATRRAVASLDAVVADLDRVLGHGSICFPIAWEDGLNAQLPHLMGLKNLTVRLCGRALHRQAAGQSDLAWQDLSRAVRLVAQWREPVLISHLVRQAMGSVVIDAVQRLLRHGPPPSQESWRAIDGALLELDDPTRVTHALRGELLLMTRGLQADSVQADPALAQELSGISFSYRLPVFGRWKWSSDRLEYVRLMAEAIRATRRPPREALAAMDRLVSSVGQRGELAKALFPALSKTCAGHLEACALLRLARSALALAREASAGLPQQLNLMLLDPTASDSLPIQWIRLGPRHGRLWCVGRDGRDDGGDQNAKHDLLKPDVVFELRLPKLSPAKTVKPPVGKPKPSSKRSG